MTDEGNYYYYPFIVPDDVLSSYVTFIIRKDLLDKAGLPVPETLDEWETALYAFRDMGVKTRCIYDLATMNLESVRRLPAVLALPPGSTRRTAW